MKRRVSNFIDINIKKGIMFSTKKKIVIGYILSGLLILSALFYIHDKISLLTADNDQYTHTDRQKKIINRIIDKLYRIEIAGMSLGSGEHDEYFIYKKNMADVKNDIDSLRSITQDKRQKARLDSVKLLLAEKDVKMQALLHAIRQNNPDSLYRQHIESIMEEHDSIVTQPRVVHKIVTHTQVRTEEAGPKNFFKRLGRLFSTKKDSAIIRDTIHEEFIDTTAYYSNADTIATILKNIQETATHTRQQQAEALSASINDLQKSSMRLSAKVQQLLSVVEHEERVQQQQKNDKIKDIRNQSAYTLGLMAFAAIALAVIFIIIIWRDITRSNKYRNELEKAKQRAEQLLKMREQLMLTITHDIKAPAGSIIGYSELLERITHDERQRFYVNNMQNSAHHLLQLINSLLDFHRLDADKVEEQSVLFNPKELFDNIAASYIPIAEKKEIDFIYRCDKSADSFFMGDPFHTRQITENLLSNAVKFTSQGNVSMNIALRDNTLSIVIGDTGCGIPREEQEKIFKEFTRLKNAQGAEGFGLGLAITKKLTALLHGTISVHSKEAHGTTFEILLPLRSNPQNNETQEHAVCTQPQLPPSKILIIDDDIIQLQLTKAMLEGCNSETTCCRNTHELLESLRNNTYNIILTDIQMPEANGFEIYDIIRKQPYEYVRRVPIMAVTARHDIDIDELRARGFAHCLHKPFTQKELTNAIAQTLGDSMQIDFSALTEFSLDDPKATMEIMKTFIDETEKMYAALQEALANSNMKKTTEITHKLLPLFKMLNATNAIGPLEWFESRRNEQSMSQEAKEKAACIIDATSDIIEQTKKKIKDS